MSALTNTAANGVDSGLVVLREVVASDPSPTQSNRFSRRERTASGSSTSILRIVSRDSSELLGD